MGRNNTLWAVVPNVHFGSRVCEKSGDMLPVGKILTKAPLFVAPSHSSSCFTGKRKGKVQSFPTVSLWSDFLHRLGHLRTFGERENWHLNVFPIYL